MSSSASGQVTIRGLKAPKDLDGKFFIALKKRTGDATFTLSLSDATLKSPTTGQSVAIAADIPLADGVKSNVVYFVDKKAAEASLSVSSFKPAGRDLNVTAIYKTSGDQFILKETWTIDKNNKVSGQYNFSNEEAVFGYDVSRSGVTVSGTYNILKESPTLAIKKNASPNTYAASFGMKDKSVALTWNHTSDLKYAIRLTGKMSRRLLESPALTVIATKEFLL